MFRDLDFLKLTLAEEPDRHEIHGKIRLFYVDYTVTILIDGLIARPSIHLLSEPPLSEKQLIAVLLFGRSLDFLDADEVNSVGHTRSALAEGAIGRGSLYALASTPIESIAYDGTSKVFTAKVRLSDGTSMNIGTDLASVKALGVRKRLGKSSS